MHPNHVASLDPHASAGSRPDRTGAAQGDAASDRPLSGWQQPAAELLGHQRPSAEGPHAAARGASPTPLAELAGSGRAIEMSMLSADSSHTADHDDLSHFFEASSSLQFDRSRSYTAASGSCLSSQSSSHIHELEASAEAAAQVGGSGMPTRTGAAASAC
jgi:hypothetical protein